MWQNNGENKDSPVQFRNVGSGINSSLQINTEECCCALLGFGAQTVKKSPVKVKCQRSVQYTAKKPVVLHIPSGNRRDLFIFWQHLYQLSFYIYQGGEKNLSTYSSLIWCKCFDIDRATMVLFLNHEEWKQNISLIWIHSSR